MKLKLDEQLVVTEAETGRGLGVIRKDPTTYHWNLYGNSDKILTSKSSLTKQGCVLRVQAHYTEGKKL